MDVDTIGKWFILLTILGPMGLLIGAACLTGLWYVIKDVWGK